MIYPGFQAQLNKIFKGFSATEEFREMKVAFDLLTGTSDEIHKEIDFKLNLAKEISKNVNFRKPYYNFRAIHDEHQSAIREKKSKIVEKLVVREIQQQINEIKPEYRQIFQDIQYDYDFFKISNQTAQNFQEANNYRESLLKKKKIQEAMEQESNQTNQIKVTKPKEQENSVDQSIEIQQLPFQFDSLIVTEYTQKHMDIYPPWTVEKGSFQMSPLDHYTGEFEEIMDFAKFKYSFYIKKKLVKKEKELYGVTELKQQLQTLRVLEKQNFQKIKLKEKMRNLQDVKETTIAPQYKIQEDQDDNYNQIIDQIILDIQFLNELKSEYDHTKGLTKRNQYLAKIITEKSKRLFNILLIYAQRYLSQSSKGIPPQILFSDQPMSKLQRKLLLIILQSIEGSKKHQQEFQLNRQMVFYLKEKIQIKNALKELGKKPQRRLF